MNIEQIYTHCLAEASYYIESNGEAAIVDPIRDVDIYIKKAEQNNAKIIYVLETHFHADFVSGHLELARKTGAQIIFGPGATADFPIRNAADNEHLPLGKGFIKALHTPGHTPESTCYILVDEQGEENSIFTGDTLFVGDVGRPDLLDGVIISKEEQVKNLYHSLQSKIKTLPDHMIVYPGHGPGSLCGKSIGKDTTSTIGREKSTNYALQDMDISTFADIILKGQLPAPKYFVPNAIINRKGYDTMDDFYKQSAHALSPEIVRQKIEEGRILLDTRSGDEYAAAHISGSIQIGLDGSFAVWAGTLIDLSQPLMVLTQAGREMETILRLARVGFTHVEGWLEGGIENWHKNGHHVSNAHQCEAVDVFHIPDEAIILDVRNHGEFNDGHLPEAKHIPLRDLEKRMNELAPDKEYYIHCAGGYRSVVAQSIMERSGIHKTINVKGGYGELLKAGLPVESELS